MNAAIALLHRCSEHGPSVVFTSQPFHLPPSSPSSAATPLLTQTNSQPPPSLLEHLKHRKTSSSSLPSSPTPSAPTPQRPSKGRSFSSPTLLIEPPDESSVVCADRRDPETITCTSCNPVFPVLPRDVRAQDVKGFVHAEPGSNGELAENVCYIGNKIPSQRKLYTALQEACIRSFSGETVPGREGPVFFGDDKRGYALSYIFTLRDCHAHGGQRLFSFVVLMADRLYLVASWTFLVDKLKSLAEDLQRCVARVDNANRERRNKKGAKEMLPEYYLKRQAGTPLRSLVELTGLPDLFSLLHASFSWILRACARRLIERESAMITRPQDHTKACSPSEPLSSAERKNLSCQRNAGNSVTAHNNSAVANSTSTSSAAELSAAENRLSTECPSHQLSFSLADLERSLGFAKFRKLVWNVVIGNQVVATGPHRWIVVQVLNSLKELLPENIIRAVEYSKTYQESWMCNFLGLEEGATVPEHVDRSQIILLNEYCHEHSDTPRFALLHGVDPPSTSSTPPAYYASTPAQRQLQRQMAHFGDIHTSNVSEPLVGNTPKNRVLLVDQMLRIISLGGNTRLTHVRLDALRRVWLGHAQQLYRLVLSGCAGNRESRKTLMTALKVHETDLSVLRFWMGGVRKCSRTSNSAIIEKY